MAAELARSSGGHRYGGAVSTWEGFARVGLHAPICDVKPASKSKGFDIFQLDVETRWGSTLNMLRSFVAVAPSLFDLVEKRPELFNNFVGELPNVDTFTMRSQPSRCSSPSSQ